MTLVTPDSSRDTQSTIDDHEMLMSYIESPKLLRTSGKKANPSYQELFEIMQKAKWHVEGYVGERLKQLGRAQDLARLPADAPTRPWSRLCR